MALLPQYAPFFKYRGTHDIYELGWQSDSYDKYDQGSGIIGTTDYIGFFIYNPQNTNGSTGKIIKGDFALYGTYKGNVKKVGSFAAEGSWDIKVRLFCHDLTKGTNPNNSAEWVDMTHCLQVTPNNTCMKIITYWDNGPYRGYPIYGMGVFENGIHVTDINLSKFIGGGASGLSAALLKEGYTGYPGYWSHSFYFPEVVGYRYHSNNGNWAPGTSSPHIKAFYPGGFHNVSGYTWDASSASKSKVDGGGGDELTYKFIFNQDNGVGLDYFRLTFTVNGKMSWSFPQEPGFYDYNRIDNPLLSVPDYCNVNTINWPVRHDAWSYYYNGTKWVKEIPLFKFYDGSSWTCF